VGVKESRVSQIHSVALIRLRARLEEIMSSGKAADTAAPARVAGKGESPWKKS